MPAELEPLWPCYRLVLERLATQTEIDTTMSIDDVDRLCIALDAWRSAKPEGSA